MGQYAEAVTAAGRAVVMNPSNASYQHLRAALEDVAGYPVDTQADLLFVLPDPGCFQAAAAYTVRRTCVCPPKVWNVSTVAEVVPMMFSF